MPGGGIKGMHSGRLAKKRKNVAQLLAEADPISAYRPPTKVPRQAKRQRSMRKVDAKRATGRGSVQHALASDNFIHLYIVSHWYCSIPHQRGQAGSHQSATVIVYLAGKH